MIMRNMLTNSWNDSVQLTMIIAVSAVATASTLPGAPAAHADDQLQFFQSPSGNIGCDLYLSDPDTAAAACEARDHTWVAPPRPADCRLGWGHGVSLVQGQPAQVRCSGDTVLTENAATLPYGTTRAIGQITCGSEPSGITCTDSGSGHYFRIARDTYELH